jgi:hypothetical protein
MIYVEVLALRHRLGRRIIRDCSSWRKIYRMSRFKQKTPSPNSEDSLAMEMKLQKNSLAFTMYVNKKRKKNDSMNFIKCFVVDGKSEDGKFKSI